MLRMFNAEPPVNSRLSFVQIRVQIEYGRNRAITNRMSADLQTSGICLHHSIAHLRKWLHLLAKQTRVAGIVTERLKQICCARSQGAVCKSLQRTGAQKRGPESVLDSNL